MDGRKHNSNNTQPTDDLKYAEPKPNANPNTLAIQPSGNKHVFQPTNTASEWDEGKKKLWNNFAKMHAKIASVVNLLIRSLSLRSLSMAMAEKGKKSKRNSYTKLSILTHAHQKFTFILLESSKRESRVTLGHENE